MTQDNKDGEAMASVENLNETLAQKKKEKYDVELEKEVRAWLATFLEEPQMADDANPLPTLLRDGLILCKYALHTYLKSCILESPEGQR